MPPEKPAIYGLVLATTNVSLRPKYNVLCSPILLYHGFYGSVYSLAILINLVVKLLIYTPRKNRTLVYEH